MQDLVIPSFKHPSLIGWSPLLGWPVLERNVTLSLQGNLGDERLPNYSRGIRQRLKHLSGKHRWRERHNFVITDRGQSPFEYARLLSSSVFCLVVPGELPWQGMRHAVHAVMCGCCMLHAPGNRLISMLAAPLACNVASSSHSARHWCIKASACCQMHHPCLYSIYPAAAPV